MNKGEHQRKREELNQLMLKMLSLNLLGRLKGEISQIKQNLTILSEPCTPHKSSLAKKLIKSVGGTPVQGSEDIVPVTWVSGPPTQVQ